MIHRLVPLALILTIGIGTSTLLAYVDMFYIKLLLLPVAFLYLHYYINLYKQTRPNND